ncbi:hypothetical protein E4T50_13001 [Aureobasidium sp. EXF-12298]|nr:hypothetical protein E4T50_13001 [Aureobasidium sp. EXF-12298]
MILTKVFQSLLALTAISSTTAMPTKRDTKVGYLFTSFPVDDEAIYLHLSNGNDPLSYQALSLDGTPDTQAILRSDVGTKGVRDSFIVPSQDGSKFWLIATDLLANNFTNDFNAATRFGSRQLVIWESEDLATWGEARLTPDLVNSTAGNAWAPEAYWEPLIDAYIVIFASRFWSDANPERTGPQPPNKLMYVTTTDFVTFSEAELYFYPGYPVIDATFIATPDQGPNVWYRWIKSEVDYTIYQQRSENGILGDWVNVGGASDDVRVTFASQYSNNEGPLIFRDNLDAQKFHLWIDENDLQTYIPATADTLDDMSAWVPDDMSGFPKDVKHGKVLAVNQQQYDAILAKYKVVGS